MVKANDIQNMLDELLVTLNYTDNVSFDDIKDVPDRFAPYRQAIASAIAQCLTGDRSLQIEEDHTVPNRLNLSTLRLPRGYQVNKGYSIEVFETKLRDIPRYVINALQTEGLPFSANEIGSYCIALEHLMVHRFELDQQFGLAVTQSHRAV